MSDDFDAIYTRITAVTALHTQTGLAEFFNVRQSSISDAKKRRAIPDSWLLKLLREKNINPDWLMTGTGRKYMHSCDNAAQRSAVHDDSCLRKVPVHKLVSELGRRFADCRLEVKIIPQSPAAGSEPEAARLSFAPSDLG